MTSLTEDPDFMAALTRRGWLSPQAAAAFDAEKAAPPPPLAFTAADVATGPQILVQARAMVERDALTFLAAMERLVGIWRALA